MKYHKNPTRLQDLIEVNEPKKKEVILKWCHDICAKENIIITDFKTNFSNGIGLCILMNLFSPSNFDIDKIKKESIEGNIQTHINLIKNALILGMKYEIDAIIDASSIQDSSEEYLFVLYLNQIHQRVLKFKAPRELTSIERTRSFFQSLEKNSEKTVPNEKEPPMTPKTMIQKKVVSEELSNERSKHQITLNQLEEANEKISQLMKSNQSQEDEIQRLKIENENKMEILVERLDSLQKEHKIQMEKTELEMNEKERMIRQLIEEKSIISEQNKVLKSVNSSNEFKEKYDSFVSEQDLQSEIKSLNERIEQYTKGIMKVQNKHVREMERLALENETNSKNLTKAFEETLQNKIAELTSRYENEKNEIIEEYENKIENMKQEYESEINQVKSQRDSMQMTLEEYKINGLETKKKPPVVMSSKAKTLLMGDDEMN